LPPEIVCFSGNPALDRRLRVSSLRVGEVNRAWSVESLPGGKAAHVAMAFAALGGTPVWTGFLGGAIGQQCSAGLRALGINVAAVPTTVPTRVNLELIEDSGMVTEILEPGAAPTLQEQAGMIELCAKAFDGAWKGSLLVISGSLPSGMDAGFYASLITAARAAGSEVFLDTSGDWLLRSLQEHPQFVKINSSEAAVLVQPSEDPRDSAIAAARELLKRGAKSAAITLGEDGLVWLETGNGPLWTARPPKLDCVSPVGCGDTTFAGFAHASLNRISGAGAIRFAAACGAANCLAKQAGRISMLDVQSLAPRIHVERL
jgi:tagatose 6-phosphate kinase